jgi:heat shock protein HslJ
MAKSILLTFSSIILFIACGAENSSRDAQVQDGLVDQLSGKKWVLLIINGESISADDHFTEKPFIQFGLTEKNINGVGGCNSYFGVFSADDNRSINFSDIAATKMACDNMKLETDYFRYLNSAKEFEIRNQTELIVFDDHQTEILVFISED